MLNILLFGRIQRKTYGGKLAKKTKAKKEEEFKGKIYGPASEKQKMILESDAAITVIGGAAGCLSKDHEVLTPSGWIKISEWKGQQILQYHKDTGVAEFLKPEEFVKLPCDKLTRIEGSGICQELSDEHTVLYKPDYKLESRTLPFAEVAKRHAKSKTKGWTGKFITTFNYSGHGIDMTEGELRLQVAVMADGRVVKEGKDNYTQMRFGKERKYLRLIELCEKFGLRYDDRGAKPCERYSSGLEYEVIVWPKTDEKHFTERYYQCSKEQLMIILDEVFWWDGSFAKAYGGKSQGSFTGRYFSKCKQDADFIQFAGAALGFNTIISTDERGDHCFTTNVMERGHGLRSLANKNKKAEFKEFVPEDGYKYCFVTQTGFFVTRLRDCVVVTGNSGKSFLLQLMALRYVDDPNTRCVMFRRTTPQLTGQGGLYETAKGIYLDLPKKFRPVFKEKDLKAVFPSGASIKYSHLEYEQDKYNHQGE